MFAHIAAASLLIVSVSGSIAGLRDDPPVAPNPLTPMPTAAAAAAGAAGGWSGAIKLPGVELKVQVTLAEAGGRWLGTIDIPQQSARGLKLERIEVNGDKVKFSLADTPGDPTFDGTLAGDTISGTFTQAGGAFPFELTRGDLPKAKRPQNPTPPFPYGEEQLVVENGPVKIAGTLTLPKGEGPFPAVILVSGSGPQNRDEEIFEHRPFAVWADFLTRAGIAVLRYDDRGVGESSGSFASATTSDFASDTEALVRCLNKRSDIAAIGIMGHSEGGIIAPMVAARNADVDFIITLAGPSLSGAEVMVEQNRALARTAGMPGERVDKIGTAAAKLFEALDQNAGREVLRQRMLDLILAQTGKDSLEPDIERAADQALTSLEGAWFRQFLSHDPGVDLRKVKVPVLALLGERDVQVTPEQNAPPAEAAIKAAGNPQSKVQVIAGANHMFQPCTTGGVEEYEKIETTVDPAVLAIVRDWIREVSKPANP